MKGQPMLQFDNAPCTTADPEIFFPDPSDLVGILEAKTICSECELINQCLDLALKQGLKYGIFGGMTPKERERHRILKWKANYRERKRAMGVSV